MRRVLKIILFVVLGIVGILVIWALADSFYQAWQGRKWREQTNKFQASLEQPYREDVYGGKTPEETWSMFLDALKKDDIELASKYYDVAHQEKGKQMIEKMKAENKLTGWIKELETLEKDETQSISSERKYYSYKYFDVEFKKNLWSTTVFYQNPYTKIWKIIY